jgi:ZIP family zinc transporter
MQIILYSAIAGVCGMGLGALITAILFKRPSSNVTCYLLMFAGGVMTSIVCFGLVPESIYLTNVSIAIVGLIIGVVVILLLNRIIDRATSSKNGNLDLHNTPAELYHENQVISTVNDPAMMLRSGTIMLIAIGLHNIPEGLAIGAGGSLDERLGIILAVMIALHNIPEGMAVAAPLASGGINRWKVVWITALCGAPTLIGGIIGVIIGGISEFNLAMSLALAGGAMLYVVFGEIIPQAIVMTKNRMPSIILLLGILVGIIVTQL